MTIGAVDLFCGVGGLTYGLQQTGINVVAGIDIDPSCKYPYTANNKSNFIEKSIDEVSGIQIKKMLKGYDVKVLVGCAPCQPFSRHQKDKNNRNKHKDWRLLYEFSRIVKESKPHIISMENVPELEKEVVFIDFIESLENLGYNVFYKVVNTAKYGVPQRRRRLILLASRLKKIRLIDETHNNIVFTKSVIGDLTPIQAGAKNTEDRLHITSHLSNKNIERIQHSLPGGTWRDWPDSLILDCHKKESGKSYGSVYGRMKWDDVSPTITTQFTSYGTGRFGHPEQDRALTLREGAMLQTFPQEYKFVAPNDDVILKTISRHIGNAVPPRLGEIVGLSIIQHCVKRKYTRRM